MNLLDRLRPKWKHADPAIRAEAVRQLTDQAILENLVDNDPSEDVRSAAVGALTDQDVLVRLAMSDTALALLAVERLSAPAAIARVAQGANQAAVRLRAVERTDDAAALQRVASMDPDAAVRARARAKSSGAQHAGRIIREVLSRLPVAPVKPGEAAEFSGSLEAICRALVQDPRFTINGDVADEEVAASGSPWPVARFLAQTRGYSPNPAPVGPTVRFYHIKVWRTDQDAFGGNAEEQRLAITNNTYAWSKASSGSPLTRPMTPMVPDG